MRATHPHPLCLLCAVHIFISLYSQLLIRLWRFFLITPLYQRKRSKTELHHLFRCQRRKRLGRSRARSAREGITRKLRPHSPHVCFEREDRGTKQNLKMAACGHGCASFSSSFKVCNDYLYDCFSDDDSTKTWYLFWEQLQITWPHHLHLSERVKERGLTQ